MKNCRNNILIVTLEDQTLMFYLVVIFSILNYISNTNHILINMYNPNQGLIFKQKLFDDSLLSTNISK